MTTENERLRKALKWAKAGLEDALNDVNDALGEPLDIPHEPADDKIKQLRQELDATKRLGLEYLKGFERRGQELDEAREAIAFLHNETGYDAGYLNDYGGGNVSWWQGYIRTELERCDEYWRSRFPDPDEIGAATDTRESEIYAGRLRAAGWERCGTYWAHGPVSKLAMLPDTIARKADSDGWRPCVDGTWVHTLSGKAIWETRITTDELIRRKKQTESDPWPAHREPTP